MPAATLLTAPVLWAWYRPIPAWCAMVAAGPLVAVMAHHMWVIAVQAAGAPYRIEGGVSFEAEVLKGAERTIEQHRPTLLLEIEDRHLDKYGRTSTEVAGSLIERGYRMHHWHGRRWARTDRVSPRRRNYPFTAAQ